MRCARFLYHPWTQKNFLQLLRHLGFWQLPKDSVQRVTSRCLPRKIRAVCPRLCPNKLCVVHNFLGVFYVTGHSFHFGCKMQVQMDVLDIHYILHIFVRSILPHIVHASRNQNSHYVCCDGPEGADYLGQTVTRDCCA